MTDGRIRERPALHTDFMRRQLSRAKERGWSLVRLARESGISLPTLSRWRRRLSEPVASGFVKVVPARRGVKSAYLVETLARGI